MPSNEFIPSDGTCMWIHGASRREYQKLGVYDILAHLYYCLLLCIQIYKLNPVIWANGLSDFVLVFRCVVLIPLALVVAAIYILDGIKMEHLTKKAMFTRNSCVAHLRKVAKAIVLVTTLSLLFLQADSFAHKLLSEGIDSPFGRICSICGRIIKGILDIRWVRFAMFFWAPWSVLTYRYSYEVRSNTFLNFQEDNLVVIRTHTAIDTRIIEWEICPGLGDPVIPRHLRRNCPVYEKITIPYRNITESKYFSPATNQIAAEYAVFLKGQYRWEIGFYEDDGSIKLPLRKATPIDDWVKISADPDTYEELVRRLLFVNIPGAASPEF